MKIGRSLRGTRAAVFAVACVGVSAAGHVWMSGAAIPAWALALALVVVGGAGYAVAGRQRGFAPIAGLMLAGELGLHLLFAAAQKTGDGGAMPSMPGMPDMPGMTSMPGMVMPHPVPAAAWLCGHGKAGLGMDGVSPAPLSSMGWMSAHHSAGMIAVHVVAGVLCAWWLWRGEAAAFRLLRALAQFAVPLLVIVWPGVLVVADLTSTVPDDRDERAPAGRRLLVHAVVRRGPPACVFSM